MEDIWNFVTSASSLAFILSNFYFNTAHNIPVCQRNIIIPLLLACASKFCCIHQPGS